ncbi:MAG TPA: hypothetical protein V6D17_08760 [Candidatus Obscuribacterales bacterium]
MPKGSGVCIQISHKNDRPESGEVKAAANMILRLWVDAQVNNLPIVLVKVPSQSFNSIISELQMVNCSQVPEGVLEDGQPAVMSLLIVTERDGQKARLKYE